MTRLALFDLDHTLIPADSDYAWGCFMIKLGIVDAEQFTRDNERFFADYKNGCLDIHEYLRVSLAPLTRYPRATLDAWHEQFMHEVITPLIRPEARELVAGHQREGDLCCMITATNAFVTAPIARAFAIPNLIAIDLATADGSPTGLYTGEITGTPSFQQGKITRTREWLASMDKTLGDFERTFFYSDSRNDIPLLEQVSDPIATNPDDTLRALAQSKGWRVLDLFN